MKNQVSIVVEHALNDVTPEMIDWWWNNIDNSERYKLWHPEEHVDFKWLVDPKVHGHVGAISASIESAGDGLEFPLRIRWEDPKDCPINTHYSHVLMGSCLDDDDDVISQVIHQYEKSENGTVMTSTFIFPKGLPPFINLSGLYKHNVEEMSQFSIFLPKLFAENL